MGKIIVSNYVTLDGYFAGPNGEIDWFVWDKELAEASKELLNSMDTLLFGRVTYELMASYWPTVSSQTEDPVIIDAMNNLPKIVFSRTLDKIEWNNSRLIKNKIVERVATLKQEPGKDMVIYGSGSIVSAFAQAGLIDDYWIFVNPVVLGSGKVLFKGLDNRLKLKLLNTKAFRCGVALLKYEPEGK
jgi:dihydrofolate reductase